MVCDCFLVTCVHRYQLQMQAMTETRKRKEKYKNSHNIIIIFHIFMGSPRNRFQSNIADKKLEIVRIDV